MNREGGREGQFRVYHIKSNNDDKYRKSAGLFGGVESYMSFLVAQMAGVQMPYLNK
jgi:hypothetical protein